MSSFSAVGIIALRASYCFHVFRALSCTHTCPTMPPHVTL